MSRVLTPANVSFDKQGLPYSKEYGDYYFSRDDGLAESRYVFLQGNSLPQRWQARSQFSIAETGFGTGLNLLATWQSWMQQPGSCSCLHYIAIEKHPLNPEQLQQALALWPELAKFTQGLLAVYPHPIPGFHHRWLVPNFSLTLLFGDIAEILAQFNGQADAWYLDGFAPDRNPAMWKTEVLSLIARNSAAEATFSTFTAAGKVRRNLLQAGFAVSKAPGFGRKREMLYGILATSPERKHPKPWLDFTLQTDYSRTDAIVIGAGLAGSNMAHALAQRGWQVTVLEHSADAAQGASANPAAVVMPRLSAKPSLEADFYLTAYLYTLQLLAQYPGVWFNCGVLQTVANEAEQIRLQQAIQAYQLFPTVARWQEADEASIQAGIDLPKGGLWLAGGGVLSVPEFCCSLLQSNNIHCQFNRTALKLERHKNEWQVVDQAGKVASSSVVVIASAMDSKAFSQTDWLPLWPYRGQTSALSTSNVSLGLKTVLCGKVYLTPARAGEHCLGATYSAYEQDTALRASDDQANLAALQQWLPQLATNSVRSQFAGIRTTTPGRLPLVGPAPDADQFRQDYHDLFKHGKPARHFPPAQHHPGLYILTGLGSRGAVSAPLAAEYLAALINQESLPLPQKLIDALNPARFLVKAL